MFIELLDAPETHEKDGIDIVCTHVAIGATVQPWNDPPVTTYTVRGVINKSGKFIAVSEPDYTRVAGDDFAALVQLGDAFSLGDLKQKVGEIKAREAAETAEREAEVAAAAAVAEQEAANA